MMGKLQGIKAVLLDIDNTLLDFHAASRLSMEKALIECGLPFDENTVLAFHKVNDDLWGRLEKGTITRDQLHRVRWSLVLDELGIDGDGPAVEQRFLEHLATDAVPIEGSYELLEYLHPRYTVCIASNALYKQQISRLTGVDMLKYFHKQLISEQLGAAKPSKEYFDACFMKLRPLKPSECIIIGDSVTADIEGGRNYGLHTCWFDQKGTGAVCEKADYTVRALTEIKEIL